MNNDIKHIRDITFRGSLSILCTLALTLAGCSLKNTMPDKTVSEINLILSSEESIDDKALVDALNELGHNYSITLDQWVEIFDSNFLYPEDMPKAFIDLYNYAYDYGEKVRSRSYAGDVYTWGPNYSKLNLAHAVYALGATHGYYRKSKCVFPQ